MAKKPSTIDEYIAGSNRESRAALEALRRIIRKVAPGAEECISYGLPAFRFHGVLVAFGATAKHCALYPMSTHTVAHFYGDLGAYDTSKGTIRFQPGRPLPSGLVRKIVKSRIAENLCRSSRSR